MRKTSLRHGLLIVAVAASVWSMWAVTNLPAQVVEAGACVTPPSGLVGWWPGDGSATDVVAGNDGTLLGGTFFTTSKVGAGFTFDTDDDRVSIAHHTNYDVQSPGFTVQFWMKGIKNQPHSLFDVVDKSHGWIDSMGWTFQGDSSTGRLAFAIGAGGAGIVNFVSALGPDVLDGTFHHFVGTWDGSTISVYVDGTLEATTAFSAPVNNSRSLNLAYSWGGGSPQRFFKGVVDELAIFSRALTETEVQSIFDAGSAGMCKNGATPVPLVGQWGIIVMAFAMAAIAYGARRRLAKES